jgi:uncharacterized protein (TIGR03435 family)
VVFLAYHAGRFEIAWPRVPKDHDDRYDIEATMPPDTSKEQLALMFQSLLRDRLEFRAHRGLQSLPSYVLGVSDKGLKISRVPAPSCLADTQLGRLWSTSEGWSIKGDMSMAQIVEAFGGSLDRPFVDRTGLQGYYRIELAIPRDTAPLDHNVWWNSALFFREIEKQLGLKIEPRMVDTDTLVVDSFQATPTPN